MKDIEKAMVDLLQKLQKEAIAISDTPANERINIHVDNFIKKIKESKGKDIYWKDKANIRKSIHKIYEAECLELKPMKKEFLEKMYSKNFNKIMEVITSDSMNDISATVLKGYDRLLNGYKPNKEYGYNKENDYAEKFKEERHGTKFLMQARQKLGDVPNMLDELDSFIGEKTFNDEKFEKLNRDKGSLADIYPEHSQSGDIKLSSVEKLGVLEAFSHSLEKEFEKEVQAKFNEKGNETPLHQLEENLQNRFSLGRIKDTLQDAFKSLVDAVKKAFGMDVSHNSHSVKESIKQLDNMVQKVQGQNISK